MKELIRLCEQGRFQEAIPLLDAADEATKASSEYHRIYGQVRYELKQFPEALNHFIESLRINPDNQDALIMTGNYYALIDKDIDTAWTYFDKVIKLKPDNYVVINNIAGLIAQSKDYDRADELFRRSLEIAPDYPNAWYGRALIHDKKGELIDGFEAANIAAIKAIEQHKKGEFAEVHRRSVALMKVLAQDYLKTHTLDELINPYLKSVSQSIMGKIHIHSISKKKLQSTPTTSGTNSHISS